MSELTEMEMHEIKARANGTIGSRDNWSQACLDRLNLLNENYKLNCELGETQGKLSGTETQLTIAKQELERLTK